MARRRIGAAGLLCVMALVAASCTGGGAARPAPVRGGTLRVVDAGDTGPLDPALASTGLAATLARAYARTLYSWDLRTRSERQAEPVPDLAAAPAIRPADGRTWTFTIRSGVRYGPPVNRAVTAADFVTAVERLYGKGASGAGPGRFFADQIAGARDYGAGRARTISGLAASGSTLRVTLERPSASVPPWLALAPFAPVPAEARTVAGLAARPAATGPYMVGAWTPGRSLELVRNPNWDARSDPLRPAWLDRIVIEQGLDPETIQRRIQAGQADLSLDSEPPNRLLHQLATDPVLSRRFALMTTGCLRYLALAAGPGAGPTSDRRVRQAVNWALDRLEVRYARGGPFAGDPAATILSPTMPGFEQSRRYQSADGHADPASARRLLADAGYPNGVSLRSASPGVDKADAVADAVRRALAGAGIRLEPTGAPSRRPAIGWRSRPPAAGRPAAQLADALACPAVPGDATGAFFRQVLGGPGAAGGSQVPGGSGQVLSGPGAGGYDNPAVTALLDRAAAEPDPARQAELWAGADRAAMEDAAVAPYLYDMRQFFWSARVRDWTYSPWTQNPDLPALWVEGASTDSALKG